MAASKKMTGIVIAVCVFAVVLIFGLYYYMVKMTSDGEAKIADIPIPAETRLRKSSFDVVERTKLRWKDAVLIRGWVAKENVKKETRDLFLVLKSKKNTFIYKIEQNNRPRPDVTAALHLDSLIKNHGFELTIPLKPVKGDSYKLGFIIEDETGKYYSSANKTLIIPADIDSTIRVEAGLDPETIAHQVTVSLSEPTRDLNYNIDKVKQTDDYITVAGWGYLNGLDAASKHTYLLLKKDKNVSVFDLHTRIRKDVTRSFIKEKLNLDSSGFVTSVPVENLEKGRYQLGLYITIGNQTGLVYSNKYVEIGK
jgi:hypothetical protein